MEIAGSPDLFHEDGMFRSMVIRALTFTALGLLCLGTLSPALCSPDARQQGSTLCRLLLHIQRRVAGESEADADSNPQPLRFRERAFREHA
jgi:hypothetical protein